MSEFQTANQTTRRDFVRNTLVAGAAVTTAVTTSSAVAAPMVLSQGAKGANDRIGVGFIGTEGL